MKKEILKKKVFDSAWHIVESQGMSQLNIRKLAELSLCSIGSVYNAFGSFQDLQLEINVKILGDLYLVLFKTLEAGIKNQKSFESLFKDLGLAYIQFALNQPLLWKALFEYFPQDPIPSWYQKMASDGIYQLSDRIAQYFEMPPSECERIVGFFWSSIHGVTSIILNKKMDMVRKLFESSSFDDYVDYCLMGLLRKESYANV